MTKATRARTNRLLAERPLPRDGRERTPKRGARPARSVTVNLTESPLGWLKARGLISERQFVAGETLREAWEQASLGPAVTMRWDVAPPGTAARAAPDHEAPTMVQLAARKRFDDAAAAVGEGLADILWRVVCAGEGMRDAEQALGWPARAGRVVLGIALDRLADYYRIR
ncbi:MAG TPA: DUF6456 domain-containing protein [Allosphingosinicella sp.]|nr:DUF6456 domain-containing protein [Allosphingosinicella sp.]